MYTHIYIYIHTHTHTFTASVGSTYLIDECSWSAGFLSPAVALDPFNACKKLYLHMISAEYKQTDRQTEQEKTQAGGRTDRRKTQTHTACTTHTMHSARRYSGRNECYKSAPV